MGNMLLFSLLFIRHLLLSFGMNEVELIKTSTLKTKRQDKNSTCTSCSHV